MATLQQPPTGRGLIDTWRSTLDEDGVVHIPGALDQQWLDLVALGIERNLRSPGPYARRLYEGTVREMYIDYCSYPVVPEYQVLVAESPVAPLMAELITTSELYLFFDQVWVKEGGLGRRTPWHQDLTVWLTSRGKLCGCWITIDPIPEGESLEFIRGSHHGPLYDMARLDQAPDDDTSPLYGTLPRLPDIEGDRESFDIVTYPSEPGDLLVFHPAVLHGGGASTRRRRTLSLRFYGDDVTYRETAGPPSPPFPGVAATHRPGDPLRSRWFPLVWTSAQQ